LEAGAPANSVGVCRISDDITAGKLVLDLTLRFSAHSSVSSPSRKEAKRARAANKIHVCSSRKIRLATYAVWWIKAAIQEYILRSWSLVKMGTTANQKKVFFNLRKAQSKISILDDGDMRCKKPRPRPLPVRKQFDPSDIWISFFPRPPWREIFWDQTRL
jgi:hypothetical protein